MPGAPQSQVEPWKLLAGAGGTTAASLAPERGLADTAGQQRVPAGDPQKCQEEDGDQVARAPEGPGGKSGRGTRVEVLL